MDTFGITSPAVERYIEGLLPPRHPVLAEMERFGYEREFPIVGPLVGRFFSQVVLLSGARRVLELGSGFGYSAFWFASALPEDGRVICTEGDQGNADRAMAWLRRAELDHKVTFHVGDALTLLRDEIEGDFDLIFCDIDKWEYPAALEAAVPRLRDGGALLWDNVLWSGKVTEPTDDEWTVAIQAFNRRAFSHRELTTHILPLRDGVVLAVKGQAHGAPGRGRASSPP